MAQNRKGCLLPAVISAAVVLAVGPATAWEQLEGNWCSEEEGCSNWQHFYAVTIRGNTIAIRYRNTEFRIFVGKIHEPKVKWNITGKLKEADIITGVITDPAHGKFEELLKELSKEFMKIKAVAIEGTLKKKEAGGAETTFEGGIADATLEGIKGTVKGTIKGTIKGKIGKAGEPVEGPFVGTFAGPTAGWSISGIYRPPPLECSEAGRVRSEDEHHQREYRQEIKNKAGDPEGVAEAKARRWELRSSVQKEQREARRKAGREGKLEAEAARMFRSKAQEKGREDRKASWGRGEAVADEVRSDHKPPYRAEAFGKFAVVVAGTINKDKDKITIDLPALPVLNDKCVVIDKLPAQKLRLVKQERAG